MALALGVTALFAFLWSMRSGQYEDMDGAALRVLSDDDVQAAQDCQRDHEHKRISNAIELLGRSLPHQPDTEKIRGDGERQQRKRRRERLRGELVEREIRHDLHQV